MRRRRPTGWVEELVVLLELREVLLQQVQPFHQGGEFRSDPELAHRQPQQLGVEGEYLAGHLLVDVAPQSRVLLVALVDNGDGPEGHVDVDAPYARDLASSVRLDVEVAVVAVKLQSQVIQELQPAQQPLEGRILHVDRGGSEVRLVWRIPGEPRQSGGLSGGALLGAPEHLLTGHNWAAERTWSPPPSRPRPWRRCSPPWSRIAGRVDRWMVLSRRSPIMPPFSAVRCSAQAEDRPGPSAARSYPSPGPGTGDLQSLTDTSWHKPLPPTVNGHGRWRTGPTVGFSWVGRPRI